MDGFSSMEVFVRVVEAKSLSGAARKLGLTPSAVSKHLARLEDRLSARLLQRTTRTVALTDVGAAFYERCARILADVQEAETAVRDSGRTPRGTLRLSATILFGQLYITRLLPEFLARYPELRVELVVSDRVLDMLEHDLDVAVRLTYEPAGNLVARRLGTESPIVCASPAYLRRRGTPAKLEDLAQHNCLLFAPDRVRDVWTFADEREVRVTGNFQANSASAIRTAAIEGLGVAWLSRLVVEDALRDGSLVEVLAPFAAPGRTLYVVYPQGRYLSPRVRSLVDFLVERVGAGRSAPDAR